MAKHTHQGSGVSPADAAAGDVTPPPDPTTPTPPADGSTTSSGGMMRPDPYWGPHDERA